MFVRYFPVLVLVLTTASFADDSDVSTSGKLSSSPELLQPPIPNEEYDIELLGGPQRLPVVIPSPEFPTVLLPSGASPSPEIVVASEKDSGNESGRSRPANGNLWCHVAPWLRDRHLGHPEYFCERPFGTLVCEYAQTQAFNGLARQQVLYEFDFGDGDWTEAAQLNVRGLEKLGKLVWAMQFTGQPLVIQRADHNPRLDEARLDGVLRRMAAMNIPANPGQVVVRTVRIAGLGGEGEMDFPRRGGWNVTYDNRLQQTQDRGQERLLQRLGRQVGR